MGFGICYVDTKIRAKFSAICYSWGILCSRYTGWISTFSFCCFVFFVVGFAWVPPLDADINKLWLPKGGWAASERAYKEKNFGRGRIEQYIITAKDGGNVLTKEMLSEAFDLFDRVNALSVADENGNRYTLSELCLFPFGKVCLEYGPLDFWTSREAMLADENLYETVSSDTFTTLLGTLNRALVMGGIAEDENGTVTEVKALQHWIFLDFSDDAQAKNPLLKTITEAWEIELIKLIQEPMKLIAAIPSTQRSQADVINDAIVGDVPFLAGSIFFVIICFMVGLFRYDKGRSKVTLGLTAAITILFTIASTFGMFGWCNITNYPGAFYVYFMLLALSINHHYLFIHAANRHREIFSLEERISTVTAEILPSVIISNICIFVPAVYIYATTDLEGMKSISFAAFVGLLIELLFISTWFVPCIFNDARRNRSGDEAIVRKYSGVDINSTDLMRTEKIPVAPLVPPKLRRRVSSFREKTVLQVNFLDNSNTISKFYEKFLLKKGIAFVVILGLLGFVAWGAVGISNWVQVFERGDLSAESDYLNEFLRQTSAYFGELGVPLDCVIADANFTQTETSRSLRLLEQTLINHEYLRGNTLISWFSDFMDFIKTNRNTRDKLDSEGIPLPEHFNFCLNAWLETARRSGAFFQDLKFYNETDENNFRVLQSCKFRIETIALVTMEQQTEAVVVMHETTESFKTPKNESYNPLYVFVNGGPWGVFAAFEPVRVEGIKIAYVIPAFALLLSILVTNLVSVTLISITMLCTNVVIFGVAFYQTEISVTEASIGQIMMVSMISFSYCIHFEFGYSFYQGTRTEKVIDAMWSHGSAIIYACICTIIGCLPLLACQSGLDIVFYISFLCIIAISGGYAVLMLPLILSFFGIPTRKDDYEEITTK